MKSRIFAVCMVMALLLTCMFAVPAQAANEGSMVAKGNRTILNYDFSEGAEGWHVPPSGYGGIVEENGNKFGQITKSASFISPSILVKPGENITWEFDYKNNMSFRPYIRFYDAAGNWDQAMAGVDYPAQKADWTRYTKTVKVPEGKVRASITIDVYAAAYNDAKESGADFIHCSFDNVIAVWTPTLNEAVYNGDMEVVQDNMPKGYTASGDNVTIERVTTHSGRTAIKITNTTDTTSYVSTQVYAKSSGDYITPPTDFSAYMNLTEFEDDPEDAEDGVRLEAYYNGALKNNSDWFTKTKYADETPMGWRKMMICWDYCRNTGLFELRVTLNGKGTVYVDDFYTESETDLIRNGDFEGFTSDYKPAGWSTTMSMTWGESGNIAVVREPETDNHYLKLIGVPTKNNGVKQTQSQMTDMVVGNRYKLTVDLKGASYGPIMAGPGFNYNATYGIGATGNKGKDWFRDFTVYFTAANANDSFSLLDRSTGSDSGAYASFDNVAIEPVVCETAFYDANGNQVTKAEAGQAYTAKYVGYGKNYSATTESSPVSLIYALYEKMEDGSVRLVSVKIEKGTAKYVGFITNQASLVAANAVTVQGFVPLELNASAITIPNDGKSYELRAYTWDDFTNMTPYYASISA